MPGELLTSWTIRLALLCYVAYVGGWLAVGRGANDRWRPIARWLWTAGCGLFVAHVICAFAFYHHWSHAAAWETTAAETHSLLGVRFGDGIYFSYVFLLVWVADVVRLWVRPQYAPTAAKLLSDASQKRESGETLLRSVAKHGWWLQLIVHAYLFFIALNGAIVFESGPTRWGGIAACTLLAALAGRWAYNGWKSPAAQQPAGHPRAVSLSERELEQAR